MAKDTILLSTMITVKREIRRVFEETGVRVDDWLWDCADNAELDNYDPETDWYDVEMITSQIENDADNYIEFNKKYYGGRAEE